MAHLVASFIALSTVALVLSVFLPLYYIGTNDDTTTHYRSTLVLAWLLPLSVHFACSWALGHFGEFVPGGSYVTFTWVLRLAGPLIIVRGLMAGPRSSTLPQD